MAQINSEYDVGAAFERIEDELIASMIRNMDHHRAEETEEGIRWSMWQAEQLKALERYKRKNQEKYSKQFRHINSQITDLIRTAKQKGNMQQEIRILQAIKKGWKVNGKNRSTAHNSMTSEFFKLNERKLDALIKATTYDMQKAETAILRMANDQYRRIIFNAQIYANSGAGTYEKAVDMATRDFISAGLNCVEYSNGARHTLADYADMAIRTASKRAYLQGEGEKRAEWGIHTVIMNKRGNPCPKCLPFVGKVLIDDVWSGGKASDGPYPLMSSAIAAGLYHPRCKDSHTTYFPGISSPPDQKYSKTELGEIEQASQEEAKQQYVERQEKKYGRLAEFSLDPENQQRYKAKQEEWSKQREVIKDSISAQNNRADAKSRAGTKSIAKSTTSGIMKLPKYESSVIPKAKFTEYALNPVKDPDKARAFKTALGYTTENADHLIEQIHSKLPLYEAVEKGNRGYGMTYEVIMDITGPNGKTAKVLTAWIDDQSNGEMRLTTVHVD